jgi:hypothetical protein
LGEVGEKDTGSLPPRRDGEKIQENLPHDLLSLILFLSLIFFFFPPIFLLSPVKTGVHPNLLLPPNPGPLLPPRRDRGNGGGEWTACPDELASDGLLPPLAENSSPKTPRAVSRIARDDGEIEERSLDLMKTEKIDFIFSFRYFDIPYWNILSVL